MDKPLRLLVIGVAWPMETFLDRLLRGLAAQGIQITVASGGTPAAAWLKAIGAHWLPAPMWRGLTPAELVRLAMISLRAFTTARDDARTLWRHIPLGQTVSARLATWYLLAPFAGRRWDLVYFPWNSHAITLLPLFSLGMPVTLSCRGAQVNIAPHNPRRDEFRAGLRATLEQAAAVHCVSQDILREAQIWGLNLIKARIIHPAVDPEFFSPSTQSLRSNGTFRIITTGSLIWRKGLEYALLAVRYLKDAGVRVQFEIIGDGPERDRVLFTIRDLDIQAHVTLSGKLSPELVRNRLQLSDVFILASLSEGISNAVLEAMACELPVVTSECGGIREAVEDGVEGFVTPVRDPAAMAMALRWLWESPDMRKRMGKAGREKVLLHFSLQIQVEQFVDFFREIAQKPTNPGLM